MGWLRDILNSQIGQLEAFASKAVGSPVQIDTRRFVGCGLYGCVLDLYHHDGKHTGYVLKLTSDPTELLGWSWLEKLNLPGVVSILAVGRGRTEVEGPSGPALPTVVVREKVGRFTDWQDAAAARAVGNALDAYREAEGKVNMSPAPARALARRLMEIDGARLAGAAILRMLKSKLLLNDLRDENFGWREDGTLVFLDPSVDALAPRRPKRVSDVLANPFLARPEKFHGTPAGGTHQLPGFHTASMQDKALPYAHQKGGALEPDKNVDEDCEACDGEGECGACLARWTIPDYPVVVGVDMSGIDPEPDIDARYVAENLQALAKDALKSGDPIEYFSPDNSYVEHAIPDSVEHALFQAVATHEEDPAGAFGSYIQDLPDDEALAAIRAVAAGKRSADKILMNVIGQFRYLKDVPSDRIVSVDYVRPFWDDVSGGDMGDEDGENVVDALEAAGWDIVSADDLPYYIRGSFTRVYERPEPAGARIEWHGTGYRNLLLAAPELADKLPRPPRPYRPDAEIRRNCGGNPAAINCLEQGGELLPVRTRAGEDAMCRLPGGRVVRQWDLMDERRAPERRRNSDDRLRVLERAGLAGDAAAARLFGVNMARSGDLDLRRINAVRASAGLSEIPYGSSTGCVLFMLEADTPVLVRANWDELAIALGLEDELIHFDGSSVNTPDWISRQAIDDAAIWIKQSSLDGRLNEDQIQAVEDRFYSALQDAWMPQARLKRGLIKSWIVDPINRISEAGPAGLSRTDDWDDDEESHERRRIEEVMCTGVAIEIEKIDARMDIDLSETGVTFRVRWPIWIASYELGTDDGVWLDPEVLDLSKLTADQILDMAKEARHQQDIDVKLPEKREGWEYAWPRDDDLLGDIAKFAPKKSKKRRK